MNESTGKDDLSNTYAARREHDEGRALGEAQEEGN
jgi:hypothetical protein